MLPIKSIVSRVRYKLHDKDAITYDDEEILVTINDGLRFIRRIIADIQPELIASETVGRLSAGEDTITLPARPTAIVNVRASDELKETVISYDSDKIFHNWNIVYKNHTPVYTMNVTEIFSYDAADTALKATNLRHISGLEEVGAPRAYYRVGIRTIKFYPIPDKDTEYKILTIDDIEEVTTADTSPLINDFDDFLIEYVSLRLSYGNEYDMTQEQGIMAAISSQIERILMPPPPGLLVRGYWDEAKGKGDYW